MPNNREGGGLAQGLTTRPLFPDPGSGISNKGGFRRLGDFRPTKGSNKHARETNSCIYYWIPGYIRA